MKLNNILIQPLITEKTTGQAQKKVYTFEVNRSANKDQIAETVEKVFGVEVKDVKTVIRKGKEKRVGRKMMTKKLPDRKIAFITLTKGAIDLFPQS